MGLRVVGIGESFTSFTSWQALIPNADTGAEKKELVLSLGAEKWIDFKETKDLVKDVKDATQGLGPHAAIVAAAHVRLPFVKYLLIVTKSALLGIRI